MKRNLFFCLFTVCVGLIVAVSCEREEEWIFLFNGQDLTGWKANVAPESYWVEDGIMCVHDTSETIRSHIFYVGDGKEEFVRFKNFELKIISKGEPNSNSGVFFHTDFSERDEVKHLAKGYEVQLNNAEKELRKTGSLYQVVDLDSVPVDDTNWFELLITVQDKHITVKIEGETVVDYIEPENPERAPHRKQRLIDPNGGAIALQAHDAFSTWYFKEIKLKKLPD